VPGLWTLPEGTRLCGGERLLVWADGEPAEGPLHASFRLSPTGGSVVLHDARGRPLDALDYPDLPENASYGRTPDGGEELATFQYATPGTPNSQAVTRLLVNEYNAVAADRMLAGSASDPFWGRVFGNGGDWFELAVVQDHLDLRGWQVAVQDGLVPATATLLFGQDEVLADLRSGTIVTVAENLASDVSLDPAAGDWWINLRSGPGGDGLYVSATDFNTSQQNTQITLLDATGAVAFGPMGEAINPLSGVGNDEVLKLEADPGPAITAFSTYRDGTSSTFGAPNLWSGGTVAQDFGPLRSVVPGSCVDPAPCEDANPCTDDVCVDGRCRNVANAAPCDDADPCTAGDACTDRQCRGIPVPGCCISDCGCDDGVHCTVDACSANACLHVADAAACDDADVCTDDLCTPQGCLRDPNGTCAVAGTVHYFRDGAAHVEPGTGPVPGIPIACTGSATAGMSTDAAGAYILPALWGAVTVEAGGIWGEPRAADGGAITSFDAVLIARHAVGLSTLSPNQGIAGDVSGNGEVTAFDAARVAQFAVELLDHFEVAAAAGSDWRLLRCDAYPDCGPPRYVHPSLDGERTDDFHAVLYGDVSGNWSSTGGRLAPPAEPEESAAGREDRAEAARRRDAGPPTDAPASAGVSLTLSGLDPLPAPGTIRDLTLRAEHADGMESIDLVLQVDPVAWSILDVRTVGAGTAFRLARNLGPETSRIALYGLDPFRGSGDLLVVTVRAERRNRPVPLPALTARVNEGRIPVTVFVPR